MNSITYYPSKDELLFKRHPVKGKPNLRKGRFSFWWDNEGGIQAVDIRGFTEEVSTRELARLARARNLPAVYDIGSGLLRKVGHPELDKEPDVRSAIADVQKAGCAVAKVEIVPETLAPLS